MALITSAPQQATALGETPRPEGRKQSEDLMGLFRSIDADDSGARGPPLHGLSPNMVALNHLGLWRDALPENQMALITSGRVLRQASSTGRRSRCSPPRPAR